jgi:hypothetical protein
MSFCDIEKPAGSQFLGAIVTDGNNVVEGVKRAHELGINPGGQVLGIPVPEDKFVPEEFCNRLLTVEEAIELPYNKKEFLGNSELEIGENNE